MRWHAHYGTQGIGHLYQGRFKTFPIEEDDRLLTVLRYVERNPVRAELCACAEDWEYGSAWRNVHGDQASRTLLAPWPIPRLRQWRSFVNKAQTEAEVESVRRSLLHGTPYGSERWITQSATHIELKHTLRSRGRPRKQ